MYGKLEMIKTSLLALNAIWARMNVRRSLCMHMQSTPSFASALVAL
jgi:hypothetical protein